MVNRPLTNDDKLMFYVSKNALGTGRCYNKPWAKYIQARLDGASIQDAMRVGDEYALKLNSPLPADCPVTAEISSTVITTIKSGNTFKTYQGNRLIHELLLK